MLSYQKFSIVILVLIVFVLSLLGYLLFQEFNVERSPNLEVVFLDVGQGDAILIKTPYEQNILMLWTTNRV
jgi:beta-lactamase superfamily II metal-dependent hydrolase